MKKKYFNRILLVMCACVIAYAFLLPLLFMLFTSFKGLAEAMTSSTAAPYVDAAELQGFVCQHLHGTDL